MRLLKRILQRILVLTGLAGTGKTSTLRVLAKEMGFKIEEWRNSQDDAYMDEDYGKQHCVERTAIASHQLIS